MEGFFEGGFDVAGGEIELEEAGEGGGEGGGADVSVADGVLDAEAEQEHRDVSIVVPRAAVGGAFVAGDDVGGVDDEHISAAGWVEGAMEHFADPILGIGHEFGASASRIEERIFEELFFDELFGEDAILAKKIWVIAIEEDLGFFDFLDERFGIGGLEMVAEDGLESCMQGIEGAEWIAGSGEMELGGVFDDGGDSVIGGDGEGPIAAPDFAIEEASKFGELEIGAVDHILDFETMRTEGMSNVVVGGEVDGQEIGDRIGAEFFMDHDFLCGLEGVIIAEGGEEDLVSEDIR